MKVGLNLNPATKIKDLGVGKQLIEVGLQNVKLLILMSLQQLNEDDGRIY